MALRLIGQAQAGRPLSRPAALASTGTAPVCLQPCGAMRALNTGREPSPGRLAADIVVPKFSDAGGALSTPSTTLRVAPVDRDRFLAQMAQLPNVGGRVEGAECADARECWRCGLG